jgi:hypothetical protein
MTFANSLRKAALGALCLIAAGCVAAAEPKRGGVLTYTYHPEPTALDDRHLGRPGGHHLDQDHGEPAGV